MGGVGAWAEFGGNGAERQLHDGHTLWRRRSRPLRRHRLAGVAEALLSAKTRRLFGRGWMCGLDGQPQPTPAYECRPVMTRLMKNRLNTIATNPATLIHAALRSRQPAVERACRYAA